MRISLSGVCLVFCLFFVASCGHDETVILSSAGTEVLVARDKAVMETMVDCAVAGECEGLRAMELLPSGKAFVVRTGTRASTRVSLMPSSGIRRVVILEGAHRGREGWVYERLLYGTPFSTPHDIALQRAFDRIYLTAVRGGGGKGESNPVE